VELEAGRVLRVDLETNGEEEAVAISSHESRTSAGTDAAIRPFRTDFPQEAIDDLRRRIAATRWPERETVTDDSRGVPLELMQDLARHWATDYDWRTCEAKLNALPNFMTEIDGLDIHFPTSAPSMMTRCR
jgi:Epoxide hydrolase N terminus